MGKTKYLISVIKRGVVVALHWSHKLKELGTIKALHPGCEIEVKGVDVSDMPDNIGGGYCSDVPGFRQQKRLRCIETNSVYESTLACAVDMGLNVLDVAKALRKGCDVHGYHFEYFPARGDGKKKRRKWK